MLLEGKAKGERPIGSSRYRWVYNIVMCLTVTKELGEHVSAVTGCTAG
jgi:hypothetical protein